MVLSRVQESFAGYLAKDLLEDSYKGVRDKRDRV